MKPIRFRAEAADDLHEIIAYYENIAPEALPNILTDIHRTIDRLAAYPHSGLEAPKRSFRRAVTIKYHFKIVHEVTDDAVIIVGIFRYQNREK